MTTTTWDLSSFLTMTAFDSLASVGPVLNNGGTIYLCCAQHNMSGLVYRAALCQLNASHPGCQNHKTAFCHSAYDAYDATVFLVLCGSQVNLSLTLFSFENEVYLLKSAHGLAHHVGQ